MESETVLTCKKCGEPGIAIFNLNGEKCELCIYCAFDEPRPPSDTNSCMWSYDKSEEWWSSGCGDCWEFNNDYGPHDNNMLFCPFCGKKLIEGGSNT